MAEDKQLKATRLVNAGGLQQVAQGVLTAAKAHAQEAANAVDAKLTTEVTRAKGVEEGLKGAIEALQEKVGDAKLGEAVTDLQTRMTTAEGEIDTLQQDLADEITNRGNAVKGVQDALDSEISRSKAEEERIAGLVATEKERAEGVEAGLETRLQAAEGKLVVIQGEGENSIKKALADAKSHAQGLVDAEKGSREAADTALDGKITAEATARQQAVSEEAEARTQADTALGGRIDGVVARVAANEGLLAGLEKDTVQASIDQAEQDAKDYADQAITALVNGAPEAMNTLKELADEIAANESVYNAYVAEHATAMAKQKTDLQAEIDADVLVETNRAKGVEEGLAGRLDVIEGEGAGSIKKAVADEATLRANKDTELQTAITKEVTDRETAVQGLRNAVVATFNNLSLEFVDEGRAIQVVLEGEDNLGKSPLSGQIEVPVMEQDDIDAIINGLK